MPLRSLMSNSSRRLMMAAVCDSSSSSSVPFAFIPTSLASCLRSFSETLPNSQLSGLITALIKRPLFYPKDF